MDCTTALNRIGAYLDGELAGRQIASLEDHLRSCDRCRMELRMEQDRSAAVRRHATYHRAPPALAARVGLALPAPGPEPGPAPRRLRGEDRRLRWAAIAASWLIAVALSAGLTWYAAAPGHHAQVAAEVIAAHQRSLLAGHLTDVASSDPGVVARWFEGRIDPAPPAANLASAGYTLAGGRLDYVNGRAVGAVVYRHQGRVINLFVWRASPGERIPATNLTQGGLNVLYWTRGGDEFWAVADADVAALDRLRALVGRGAS